MSAAEAAIARALAVCDEWDAEPNLPPSTYNAIDDIRHALTTTATDDETPAGGMGEDR